MIVLEVSLAMAILVGVVLFGTVITLGNERQRHELEMLRMVAQSWLLGDLQVRRFMMEETVKVADPRAWLSRLAEKVLGSDPGLDSVRSIENPEAIVMHARDGRQLAFSPLSPSMLRRIGRAGPRAGKGFSGRLLDMVRGGTPILSNMRRARAIELNLVEIGTTFDLEAGKVWELVTGKQSPTDRWWFYVGRKGQSAGI